MTLTINEKVGKLTFNHLKTGDCFRILDEQWKGYVFMRIDDAHRNAVVLQAGRFNSKLKSTGNTFGIDTSAPIQEVTLIAEEQ